MIGSWYTDTNQTPQDYISQLIIGETDAVLAFGSYGLKTMLETTEFPVLHAPGDPNIFEITEQLRLVHLMRWEDEVD